jgi:hypothetical protein
MSNNIFTKILGLFLLIFSLCIEAKIKLPALVSDGMVLQRNQKLNIWEKADANEKVEVKFLNKSYKTTADQNGNWKIVLPEQKRWRSIHNDHQRNHLERYFDWRCLAGFRTIEYGIADAQTDTFIQTKSKMQTIRISGFSRSSEI